MGLALVREAERGLEALKYEVASELDQPFSDKLYYELSEEISSFGSLPRLSPQNYWNVLDKLKYEVAAELGYWNQVRDGDWGELSSANCGAVGGRLGGRIGGNMVRKMVAYAEQLMNMR
ncbi:MAG: small, acid-soluble spore protein, alpha/beta type [Bacillota bacterium]